MTGCEQTDWFGLYGNTASDYSQKCNICKSKLHLTRYHSQKISAALKGKNKEKPAWNKGVFKTLEEKRKIANGLKQYYLTHVQSNKGKKYKPHTEAEKIKIRNGLKRAYEEGRWKPGVNIAWNRGLTKSTDSRIASYANNLIGHPVLEVAREKIRAARLKQVIPRRDTKPELQLQQALTELKIDFTTHKSILGQPDIFIEPNICIFVDGCYFHGCDECGFKGVRNTKERDITITQKLQQLNYIVYRFYQHELADNYGM